MTVLYFVAKCICWFINIFVFFLKVDNKKNLKNKGKVLVVSNHVSVWDPLLLGGAYRRQVNYIAKAELFKSKVFGFLLGRVGAFPVQRGQGDYAALKKSFEILKADRCLGIFPEGTRIEGQIGEFQKGAAAIALKMDAPIIPTYIHGDYSLFKQMRLVLGDPINLRDMVNPKDKDAAEKGTEILRDIIMKLREKTIKEEKK